MTALHVAVESTALLGDRTGVGEFGFGAMSRLVDYDDLELSAFAVSWRGRRALGGVVPRGVRVHDRAMPARPLHELWKRLDVPRIETLIGPVDVVHGINAVLPPTRAAGVITVHDLAPTLHPELAQPRFLPYTRLVQRALDRGAIVHTVSDYVRAEVLEHFALEPDRVTTVPNGIPTDRPRLRPTGGPAPLGLTGRFILALGTIQPRKDYVSLVRAFESIASRDPDVHLVIGGARGWGLEAFDAAVEASRHRDRIHVPGYIDAGLRDCLLAQAAVLAYPSLYEGFGLPPLEAMAAEVPVVATAAGAIPEVLGDAALLVPVNDSEALADAIERLLQDADLRADMVRRGSQRAALYTWERTAAGLRELYHHAHQARR